MRTCSGGILSLFIAIATVWFGLVKLQHLSIRKNPVITTFDDKSAIDAEDTYDTAEFAEDGFQIGVGIRGYEKGVHDDPRYIKWVARVYT